MPETIENINDTFQRIIDSLTENWINGNLSYVINYVLDAKHGNAYLAARIALRVKDESFLKMLQDEAVQSTMESYLDRLG